MSDNSIIIEGEEIPVDETISMEYYSPFVDNNEVVIGSNSINPRGKFSLPTKIKGNKELNRALGFLNLPSIASRNYTVGNARLKSRGVMLDQGYLKVNMAATNLNTGVSDYDVIAVFESSIIATLLKDKKVNDLAMSGIKQIPKNPINKNLYPFNGYKDKVDFDIALHLNPDVGYGHYDDPSATGWRTHTFNLLQDFAEFEDGEPFWQPGDPLTGHAALENNPYPYEAIMATNVWCADVVKGIHDADYLCFPSFASFIDDEATICNYWDEFHERFYGFNAKTGQVESDSNIGYWLSFENPLVPCYFYHQVLKHCFSEFGYNLLPNEIIDSEHFKRIYIQNTHNIVRESQFVFLSSVFNVDKTIPFRIQEDTEVNPKNHLPDIPILDFLRDFMTRFCAHFSFNGKDVTIVFNDLEKIQREIKDYNPYVEFEAVSAQGLNLSYDHGNDDAHDANPPASYGVWILEDAWRKGKKDIEITIPKVAMKKVDIYRAFAINSNSHFDARDIFSCLIPVTYNRITGYPLASYVYDWIDAFNYGPGNDRYWTFKFIDADEPEIIPPNNAYSSLSFYYGIQELDLNSFTHKYLAGSYWNWLWKDLTNYPPTQTIYGDWDLTISSDSGIVKTFWRLFEKLYAAGEVTKIRADEALDIINNHKFNQCVLWRGQMLYIASIQFDLPLTEMPKYDCYRIQ